MDKARLRLACCWTTRLPPFIRFPPLGAALLPDRLVAKLRTSGLINNPRVLSNSGGLPRGGHNAAEEYPASETKRGKGVARKRPSRACLKPIARLAHTMTGALDPIVRLDHALPVLQRHAGGGSDHKLPGLEPQRGLTSIAHSLPSLKKPNRCQGFTCMRDQPMPKTDVCALRARALGREPT